MQLRFEYSPYNITINNHSVSIEDNLDQIHHDSVIIVEKIKEGIFNYGILLDDELRMNTFEAISKDYGFMFEYECYFIHLSKHKKEKLNIIYDNMLKNNCGECIIKFLDKTKDDMWGPQYRWFDIFDDNKNLKSRESFSDEILNFKFLLSSGTYKPHLTDFSLVFRYDCKCDLSCEISIKKYIIHQ